MGFTIFSHNFNTGSFSIAEWIMWWAFTGTANKHACYHHRVQNQLTRAIDTASTFTTCYTTNTNKRRRLTNVLRSCLERWGWPNVVPDSSPAILIEKEWKYDQANAWPFFTNTCVILKHIPLNYFEVLDIYIYTVFYVSLLHGIKP